VTTWEYAHEWARPRARAGAQALTTVARKARKLALPVLGAGCFVGAAFTVSVLAGLLVAGAACFFVEWRFAK